MFKEIESIIRERYGDGLIPLHEPVIGELEKKYTLDCLESTFVSSIGQYVNEFEDRISEFTTSKYAIATTNGTSALSVALKLSGVEAGVEVITQNLTFVATANAILHIGATPVFIDSSDDNMGLCPQELGRFLDTNVILESGRPVNKKTGARIGAVVPMHVFGHSTKIDELIAVCNKFDIPVIEDAAEALGSYSKERHLGTIAPIGVLSFNGNKTITTGGGGMILCQNKEMALKAKHITTTSKVAHPYKFFHDEIGYNFRLPNINAALGCAQMDQLENFLLSKRETSLYYHKQFENLGIETVKAPKDCLSNYWLNAISSDDAIGIIEYLNSKKILARPLWELMSDLPFLKQYQVSGTRFARAIKERTVCIPSGVV